MARKRHYNLGIGLGVGIGRGGVPDLPIIPFSLKGVSFVTTLQTLKRVISAADTGQGVMSFWIRGSVGTTANRGMTSNLSLYNKMPIGNYDSRFGTNVESYGGVNWTWDNSSDPPAPIRINLGDATGGQTNGHNTLALVPTPNLTNEIWQHCFCAWRTDQASGLKRQVAYINGVKISGSTTDAGTGGAFNVNTSIAGGFLIQMVALQTVFEMAQFALWTDVNAQIVTGNSPNSVVDPSIIAKFYNNGPVNFDVSVNDGMAPLGSAPIIYYNGDASAGGFITNHGSDGAATFISTNTLLPLLQNAALGPGEIPDRPYFKWFAFNHGGNSVFAQATGVYSGVTNFGKPIALGDLLFMVAKFNMNVAFTHDPVVVTGGGSAWTLLPNSRQTVAGGRPINFVIYYKFAEAGDVTAPNVDWTGNRQPTITWTINGVQTFAEASYLLLNYGNVTSISTSDSQSNPVSHAGQTIVSKTLTAPAGKSLRVDIYGIYAYDDVGADYAPPSTQDARFLREANYSGAVPFVADEKINAAGLTGTRTAQTSSTATIQNNVTAAIILV